jgi:cytochrome c
MRQFISMRFRKPTLLTATLSAMAYLWSPLPALSQGAEPSSGQQAFNNACRTCHIMREGDNRLGPNLNKVVGRKAGSLSGYNYSSAMKETDFVWDEAKLDRFIANPDEVVPGHNMKPYGGLTSKEERTKIIAFLAASK